MTTVRNYLSLVKFSHTIFAMPFAIIGFFIAIFPSWSELDIPGWHASLYPLEQLAIKFLLMVLCMVFARSAAMAFNRYLDRDIDALNPRTAIREVPRGIITPKNALSFTLVNCLLFILVTLFI